MGLVVVGIFMYLGTALIAILELIDTWRNRPVWAPPWFCVVWSVVMALMFLWFFLWASVFVGAVLFGGIKQ